MGGATVGSMLLRFAISPRRFVFQTPRLDAVPCLIKNSCLWELVTNQVVPSSVIWLAQGWPHPASIVKFDSAVGDFPWQDEQFSNAEVCEVLGNGMNVSQAGMWFLWNLFTPMC